MVAVDARSTLLSGAKSGSLTHAYLVIGGDPSEIEQLARELADTLGISKSDFHPIEGEGTISIERIRTLIHDLSLRPHSSPEKLALIKNAQKMTPEAQNALLKTLEEPPGDAVIILSIPQEGGVLPTIASRCQKLRLSGEEEFFQADVPELYEISSMPLVERFKLAETLAKNEELPNVVDGWLVSLRKVMKQESSAAHLAESVFSVKKLISDTNVNRRLLLEQLFLELSR
jgi:DNA polymerase III delta prime subunit